MWDNKKIFIILFDFCIARNDESTILKLFCLRIIFFHHSIKQFVEYTKSSDKNKDHSYTEIYFLIEVDTNALDRC